MEYSLPHPHSLRGCLHGAYLRCAYAFWRRKLRSVGITGENSGRIMDIGCASGGFAALLQKWFPHARVSGLDASADLARRAREDRGVRVIVGNAEALPIQGSSLDVVFAMHCVEHCAVPEKVLEGVRRALKPGGLLILTTPNPDGLGCRIRGAKWKGFRHDHVSLKNPVAWKALIEDCGFRIVDEGTTGLSGIPGFRRTPLSLVNYAALFLFGYFRWYSGEAYVCIAASNGNSRLTRME